MNLEINILAFVAYMLFAVAAGWYYNELFNRAEMRKLNTENEQLWKKLPGLTSASIEAEVVRLQPFRGASRDRSLPGKDRVRARKATNRG